ncbi:MAG: MotA/TolQ/ExbB proton channel family protein [Thiomargarita sp.]|nr:MotA/TolQ/ExbB proton channel family protein [Thiomargarita sp.]
MEFSPHFELVTFLENLNTISFTVIMILAVMSILSWYLIINKILQFIFIYWRSHKIIKLFWQSTSLEPLIHYLSQKTLTDPFSNLTLQSINSAIYYEKRSEKQLKYLCTQSEFLMRNMRRAMNEGKTKIESSLTILATIGSIAPFIGLFGTVVDIYHALIGISAKGNASLDTVAGPVGEALIMTALGLVVAIPAVLGYNLLVRREHTFLSKLEAFAHDLHTCLNTGARLDMKNRFYMNHQIQPKEVQNKFEAA